MQVRLVAFFVMSVGATMLFGASHVKALSLRYFGRGSGWLSTYQRSMLNLPGYVFMLRLIGLLFLLAGLHLATVKLVSPG